MSRVRRALSFAVVALFFAFAAPAALAASVTVFAAASLKESMDDVARQFEASTGNKVVVAYGASNALARQIDAGAPADLFISADLEWMDFVDKRHLLATNSRFNLLRNTLVLVAPVSSTATLKVAPNFGLASALGADKLAMANPDSVPAGKYGKSALEALGVWAGVERQVARAENVRAALALVSRGEAPFGIVYRTDALADKGVRIVDTFPQASYPHIVYPAALLSASTSPSARPLLEFLRSAPARAIWEEVRLRSRPTSMFELSPDEWGILTLSLRVALVSVICSLPLAIGVAYGLARLSFPGKTLVDAIVHLPLVLPPVVVGFALLVLFGKRGAIGSVLDEWFGIVFAFRWTGAALASALMGFPLMVRAIRLSIEAIDRRLEVAARTLGGSRLWVFASITLPLALPGIITGTLLSFARGLGEFGATITFVSNIPGETQTLPLAIYTFTQVPGGESQAIRLSIIAVLLSIAALATSEWLTRRSRELHADDRR